MTAEKHKGIWHDILKESAALGSSTANLEGRSIVVFGDRYCGKTSLLSRLKKADLHESCKGLALDYTFIDIAEDEDVLTRLNVWQLEGEIHHKELLKFALNSETIEDSVAVIALDFSQPWTLVESLEKWLKVLEEQVKRIELPKAKSDALKRLNTVRFLSYKEPEEGAVKKKRSVSLHARKALEEIDESQLPPLGDHALDINLGIPIVVVCCKTDSMQTLSREFGFKEGEFDYIQQYIRRICLKYGASLIYTSSRKDNNCDVFMDYIEHLLYGFDFVHQPQLAERDILFVPMGWDSLEKIELDFDSQRVCTDRSTPFENVIRKPVSLLEKEQEAELIMAEDDNEFLLRHKNTLEKKDLIKEKRQSIQKPLSSSSDLPSTSPSELTATSPASTPTKPATPAPKPSSPSSAQNSPSQKVERDQISNFFNNLLKKGK